MLVQSRVVNAHDTTPSHMRTFRSSLEGTKCTLITPHEPVSDGLPRKSILVKLFNLVQRMYYYTSQRYFIPPTQVVLALHHLCWNFFKDTLQSHIVMAERLRLERYLVSLDHRNPFSVKVHYTGVLSASLTKALG